MQFDEMILEAARGIMAASSALIRAANAAQRELIDQGKVSRTPLTSSDDGQWSEGLISAARLVAAATHSLVESAQNLVQGVGTEEMLISSAKQVAASTAQLLIACKVKADPNSETGRRLQSAGNAVIKSTDNLVRAAQRVIDIEEEHILKINTTLVDRIAQEINARSDVLTMEKRLEEARNKLAAIHQAKYNHKVSEEQTDHDGYHHFYQSQSATAPISQHQYPPVAPSQPQHYHITTHRSAPPTTPGTPSFHNVSSSTTYQQVSPRSNRGTLLTGNAVPKPYNSEGIAPLQQSPILNRTFQQAPPPIPPSPASLGRPVPSAKPASPFANRSDGVSTQHRLNLDQCIQDLSQKTIGNPSGTSTFKTTATTNVIDPRYQKYGLNPGASSTTSTHQNGSNTDGYTSR